MKQEALVNVESSPCDRLIGCASELYDAFCIFRMELHVTHSTYVFFFARLVEQSDRSDEHVLQCR